MKLERMNNSVDTLQIKEAVDVSKQESSIEDQSQPWKVYSSSSVTSVRYYQPLKVHTNENVNNRLSIKWVRTGKYLYSLLDKRETKKFSFFSEEDRYRHDIRTYSVILENPSNWSDNIWPLEEIKKFQLSAQDTIRRIKEFALLKDNWDSYGAKTIKWATIIKAIEFFSKVLFLNPKVPIPFVAPDCNGNIIFEWETCVISVKHFILDDQGEGLEYIIIDKSSGEIQRKSGRATSDEEMSNIVSDLMP